MQPDLEPLAVSGAAGPSRPLKRKIAAILAADVAGYSRLVAADEEGTLRDLAAAREIFDAFVGRAGGRIFNTAGDSVMCEFDSAVEAVRAAVDIQDNLRAKAAQVDPARRLVFRIGITIGDVVERDGDLLGDGVNIAARLESLAAPGGICVSRSVHEAVGNKIAVKFEDAGERRVKNIPQAIHAYLINPPPEPLPAERAPAVELGGDRRASRVREAGREAGRMAPPFVVGLVCGAVALGATGVWTMRDSIMSMMPADPRRAELADTRPTATPAETSNPVKPAATPNAVATPNAKPAPTTAPPRNEKSTTVAPPAGEKAASAPPASAAKAPPAAVATNRSAPTTPAPPALATMPVPEAAGAFAKLATEGLVAEPRSLAEWYHNARLLEGKGDRAGALRAYAALAPAAGDAVDPLMRYAALLRGRGGSTETARSTFADLASGSSSVAVALVSATQAAPAERRAALEGFVAAHPSVAPANDLLAQEYLARSGGPTLTERRLAFDQIDQFLDAENRSAFFVDRAFEEEWVERARRRRTEIETFFASTAARPRANFAQTESGWTAKLTLPEPATAVAVRIGEQGEFVPTGFGQVADPATGRPAPALSVGLPASTGRTTLYVTYRDGAGRDAGPFPLSFDPTAALVANARDILDRFPDNWVAFRPDVPDVLSYAQLVQNRCAITKALIGFGDEPPREPLTLPACEASSRPDAASSRAVLTLPPGTEAVQVQLAFADGSESPVRTFRRP